MEVGRKNQYTCTTCKKSIISVDRDAGTTPFMVACVDYPTCKGMMRSSFYKIDQTLEPTHEFYRMTDEAAALTSPRMMQHHLLGGLAFRKINND